MPVDGTAIAYVEEAEVGVGEGGGDGEGGGQGAQPPRRGVAGGQPEVEPGQNEKEDETDGAESLVEIQGVQKDRMRRSTRSSCDWNGSLQRIVSRSGSLSFRYTQSTR